MITGIAAWVLFLGALAMVVIPVIVIVWSIIEDRRWKKGKNSQRLCPKGYAWCVGDCDFFDNCEDCDLEAMK